MILHAITLATVMICLLASLWMNWVLQVMSFSKSAIRSNTSFTVEVMLMSSIPGRKQQYRPKKTKRKVTRESTFAGTQRHAPRRYGIVLSRLPKSELVLQRSYACFAILHLSIRKWRTQAQWAWKATSKQVTVINDRFWKLSIKVRFLNIWMLRYVSDHHKYHNNSDLQ